MVPMFLKESGADAANQRGSGGPETYPAGAAWTIGGRATLILLDARRNHSVSSMRTSRARERRIVLVALGAALLGASAPPRVVAQTAAGPTAKLVGTITDTSGVPLSRAEIWLI